MIFPVDIVLDLTQDGLRAHVNTNKTGDVVRLTNREGEGCSIRFADVEHARELLRVVAEAVALR